jgi:tripartite-type tricarboxylate transporter receptor subunit TctC
MSRFSRRDLLTGAASLAVPSLAAPTRAQDVWPERGLRIIVPVAAGGTTDVLARLVADHLQTRFGRPVIVENRAGAGGFIGMDAVARAAPDGYILGMGTSASNAIGPALQRDRVPYDPVGSFTPICLVAIAPSVLVLNPNRVPVANLEEFLRFLRANPGRLNYGSAGIGTSLHLGMEMLIHAAGVAMTHVPYRGSSEMIPQLMAGNVDVAFDAFTTAWPHVQSGRLRAIAVSTSERLSFAPDLPAVAEQLPGVSISSWHGVMGPSVMPAPVVQRLNVEIASYLRNPAVVQRLQGQGLLAAPSTPTEFSSFMAREVQIFRQLVDQTGIRAG